MLLQIFTRPKHVPTETVRVLICLTVDCRRGSLVLLSLRWFSIFYFLFFKFISLEDFHVSYILISRCLFLGKIEVKGKAITFQKYFSLAFSSFPSENQKKCQDFAVVFLRFFLAQFQIILVFIILVLTFDLFFQIFAWLINSWDGFSS